ncbi:MAG: hypothetical protein ACJATN_002005 [Neolewinella sp.]|jgi:hypothetical protein
MNTFNYLFCFLFCFLFGAGVSAQEASSTRLPEEIGLRLVSLQDFDFIYKKQLDDGSYGRIRLLSANASLSVIQDVSVVGFGGAVALGREKWVPVAENFIFHYGWEPGLALNVISAGASSNNIFEMTINPFIGYVLGFQLAVSEGFTLGLEVIPSFSLAYSVRGSGLPNSLAASVGFNSRAVGLTAVYCFTRK